MEYMWVGGKNGNKVLSRQRKTDTCGQGVEKTEDSIVRLLTFKALKWNVFTIITYKDVIFMRRFRQSATNWYQSISIYQSIVIENRSQSITTQIFAIDCQYQSINWYQLVLIDINCHRLDIPGLAVSMLRRKQERRFSAKHGHCYSTTVM